MTRKEFAELSYRYRDIYKEKLLKKTKGEIMGSAMDLVMAEEAAAVADMLRQGNKDDSWFAFKTSRLDSVIRKLKDGQYTYNVFTLMLPSLTEPGDDGNYAIFDNGAKYDDLATALEQALNWDYEDDPGKLQANELNAKRKRSTKANG